MTAAVRLRHGSKILCLSRPLRHRAGPAWWLLASHNGLFLLWLGSEQSAVGRVVGGGGIGRAECLWSLPMSSDPSDATSPSGPEAVSARLECFFAGRVQGVGFRFTARRLATRCGLVGTVRNLSDGRVQMICEGVPAQIAAFRKALRDRFSGKISDESCRELDPTHEFSDFRILP